MFFYYARVEEGERKIFFFSCQLLKKRKLKNDTYKTLFSFEEIPSSFFINLEYFQWALYGV